jgi:hypothetical protein
MMAPSRNSKLKSVHKPPPVLDCARVLHYARIDRSVRYSGRTLLFVRGGELGRVPRLAIAEQEGSAGVLLFHCRKDWRVLGCSAHSSVAEAKKRAESIYLGLSTHWIKSGVTKQKAEQFLDSLFGAKRCAGCGRRPDQVRQLVSKRKLLVCDRCIRELLEMLEQDGDDPSRSRKL